MIIFGNLSNRSIIIVINQILINKVIKRDLREKCAFRITLNAYTSK